jgi:hypothetical protein
MRGMHFTSTMYQGHVAGKPRLSGALAGPEGIGCAGRRAAGGGLAERKQKRLEELNDAGTVLAFPDVLRFVKAVGALAWRPWRWRPPRATPTR